MDLGSDPQATPRPPLLHRVAESQLQVLDLALAGILGLVVAAHAVRLWRDGGVPAALVATVVVWGLAATAIALRRLSPELALALMTAAVAVGLGSSLASSFPGLLIALPMYQMAATRPRRRSMPTAGAEICALVLVAAAASRVASSALGAVAGGPHDASAALGAAVVAIAAFFVGDSVRVRRVYVAGLAEQAAQRQREAVERAQRSVAEERLQIARELHDVVAHSLSVIAIQSGVGRHVIDANPAEAKRALVAVEQTSRGALDELRRMLGVLRGAEHGPADRAPAPGVETLPLLVEQVRAAGIPVELDLVSDLARSHSLSPGAALSVYRIVQEALTNVVKHAGPASAHVELRDEGGDLVIEVLDDGRGAGVAAPYPGSAPDPAPHHGLVGMRERVALFGGSFTAGPRSEGGFGVLARFPAERVLAG